MPSKKRRESRKHTAKRSGALKAGRKRRHMHVRRKRSHRRAGKRLPEPVLRSGMPGKPAGRPATDREELLIRSMIRAASGGIRGGIDVQDLTLSVADSARRLGYKSGFYIGERVFAIAGRDTEAFFGVLDRLGLGKVLYYPADGYAIITSANGTPKAPLNANIHVFESGVMAGYLSGYVGRRVWARETVCTYNGSGFCQFSIGQVPEGPDGGPQGWPGIGAVARAIAQRISDTDYLGAAKGADRDYLLLPSLPLINGLLLEETSRILYLAGEQLASMDTGDGYKEALKRIGAYFDLDGVGISRIGRSKRVIRLKYKQYNSIDGLVRLSSSMVVGFLAKYFKSDPTVKRSVGKDGTYSVSITLQP